MSVLIFFTPLATTLKVVPSEGRPLGADFRLIELIMTEAVAITFFCFFLSLSVCFFFGGDMIFEPFKSVMECKYLNGHLARNIS